MTHPKCISQAKCLGACGTGTITATHAVTHGVRGFSAVEKVAREAAGPGTAPRFAGAMLHALIERSLVNSKDFTDPNIGTHGLSLWADLNDPKDTAKGTKKAVHAVKTIAKKLTRTDKLVYYAEAPIAVFKNGAKISPQYGDIVVALEKTPSVPILIIDLVFRSTATTASATQKLAGLKFLENTGFRTAIPVNCRVVAIQFMYPDLGTATYAWTKRKGGKGTQTQTITPRHTPTSPPRKSHPHDPGKGLLKVTGLKINIADTWHAIAEPVIATRHNSPQGWGLRLVPALKIGSRRIQVLTTAWNAASIAPIDANRATPSTWLWPLYVGHGTPTKGGKEDM